MSKIKKSTIIFLLQTLLRKLRLSGVINFKHPPPRSVYPHNYILSPILPIIHFKRLPMPLSLYPFIQILLQ